VPQEYRRSHHRIHCSSSRSFYLLVWACSAQEPARPIFASFARDLLFAKAADRKTTLLSNYDLVTKSHQFLPSRMSVLTRKFLPLRLPLLALARLAPIVRVESLRHSVRH